MHYYATAVEKEEELNQKSSIKENESIDEGYVESMNKYEFKMLKYLQSQQTYENKKESLVYIRKACVKGCFESMYEYGFLFTKSDAKIQMKPEEDVKYVIIVSDKGLIDTIALHGTLLRDGNGVEINYKEEIKYCKFGIEKGSSLTMNEYGYMFMNGLGVEVHYREAI